MALLEIEGVTGAIIGKKVEIFLDEGFEISPDQLVSAMAAHKVKASDMKISHKFEF